MKNFVRRIFLNGNFTEADLENKKDEVFLLSDDGNIKYEMKRINDYTLEYEFYASKSQIDISGYAFKMNSKNRNIEIDVYIMMKI